MNPDLSAGRDLRDDLLDRVVTTVFLEGHEPLRSAAAFETRIAQLAAEITPLEARYREGVKAERGLFAPAYDEFRWLLEELRVSLFAQQLKTRVPCVGAASGRCVVRARAFESAIGRALSVR